MKAMVLNELCGLEKNQAMLELPDPIPSANGILIRVSVCGVSHTELDEIEGRSHPPRLQIVLGHQVVCRIEATGSEANIFKIGDRVSIAWIFLCLWIIQVLTGSQRKYMSGFQSCR